VLTGDPTTTANAFAGESVDRERYQRLSDRELLRTAVRELAITCILVGRALQQHVHQFSLRKVKETATLVTALSSCSRVVVRGFHQLACSQPATATQVNARAEQDANKEDKLEAALREWEESRNRGM